MARHLRILIGGLLFALLSAAGPVLASGREGAATADAVALLVYATLAVLVASLVAGTAWGAAKARREGASVTRGCALGVAKGLLAFLALAAGATAILMVVGAAFIAFGFLSGDRLGEFWNALVDAWNLPPEDVPKPK